MEDPSGTGGGEVTNQDKANHGPRETHQDRRIDHQRRQIERREARKLARVGITK